jgi:hypothetical protein
MNYDYSTLNIGKLDYDSIKSSLVTFLQKYPQFANYDFANQASAINMFLDILSANTAYNGYYLHSVLTNSFPTTASTKRTLLLNAGLHGAFISDSVSSRCTATIQNRETTVIPAYSVFNGEQSNGSPCLFYNITAIPVTVDDNTTDVVLVGGKTLTEFSNYDQSKQVISIPISYDPSTISFSSLDYTTELPWSRVDKFSNNSGTKIFTVLNGPSVYYVTNNISGAEVITGTIVCRALESSGTVTDSAVILNAKNYSKVTVVSHTVPTGGRDGTTKDYIRTYTQYAVNTRDRIVTEYDYKDAIYSFLIGKGLTIAYTDIVISSPSVGQIKFYVPNLSDVLQGELLNDYLAVRKIAGIMLSYGQ